MTLVVKEVYCMKPVYNPDKWVENKSNNNCYSYAMRDHDKHLTNKRMPGNKDDYEGTCHELIEEIKSDYPNRDIQIAYTDDCPCNYYRVAPYLAPDYKHYEFHFYRQDEDGSWSHKPGANSVSNVDADGRRIKHPDSSNRDFGDGLNYRIKCPELCVPYSL